MAKKTTAIVPTMLRMREDLRQQLEREAKKKDHSLNAEMVQRLEQSFVRERNSAIVDYLVRHNEVGSELLRDIADEIKKHPDWNNNEAARKELIHWLYIAAYGKELPQEPRQGEEL